ncbi:MAG: zf-TFIIB domain-containing protein [Myxococcota bacterium]
MAKQRPHSTENEFIHREETKRAELERIRREQEARRAARAARKRTCPGGCETKLVEEPFRNLLIDRCPTCGGVWLDPGELEKIAPDDAPLVNSLLELFRSWRG